MYNCTDHQQHFYTKSADYKTHDNKTINKNHHQLMSCGHEDSCYVCIESDFGHDHCSRTKGTGPITWTGRKNQEWTLPPGGQCP